MASVWMLRMTVMSSAIFAVCGSNSLNHVPPLPCWLNLNIEGATGSRAWPLVIVVMRWPLRTDSGKSLSKCASSCGL